MTQLISGRSKLNPLQSVSTDVHITTTQLPTLETGLAAYQLGLEKTAETSTNMLTSMI